MRIILLRHGPAEARDSVQWPDDALRPLTTKGASRTRDVALGILCLEDPPTAIWTSPLVRARQTAEIARDVWGERTTIENRDTLRPGGSWRLLCDAMLERTELESLAIVGHEPDLGRLLGVFLFCSPNAIAIKKAGACGIEFHDQPGPGQGVLKWFLGPRALQRLAQTRKGNA